MFAELAYNKARRSLWLAWLLDNPLLVREIRRRMRGKLFSWSLIAYVAALGGVSCFIMFVSYPMDIEQTPVRELIQKVGRIGKTLFTGMSFVEGFIALFIAPMLTAGVATAEKEKDTFDFLRVTTLHERTFVLGCLLTTASFLVLVFACTLPILGLTFIFGGVSMSEILWFNLLLFLGSMAISAWGVFNSTNYSRSRSVQGSMVVLIFLALYFGYNALSSLAGSIFYPISKGAGWATAVVSLGPLILAIVVFALMASRRLYDPNNRLFNYREFAIFYGVLMGIVGGSLWWRNSAYSVSNPPADEIEFLLHLYYYLGAFLSLMAILVFATGRIERGDEVWRIRLRVPLFRIVHEDLIYYLACGVIWAALTYLMAQAYAPNTKFVGVVNDTLPVIVAGLLAVLSLARLVNGLAETRNKSLISLMLVLVILWGVCPAVGFFFYYLTKGPLQSGIVEIGASILRDLSPIPGAVGLASGARWVDAIQPVVIQLLVAVLAFIPTTMKWWRGRMEVSYRWDEAPEDAGGSRRLFISDRVKGFDR